MKLPIYKFLDSKDKELAFRKLYQLGYVRGRELDVNIAYAFLVHEQYRNYISIREPSMYKEIVFQSYSDLFYSVNSPIHLYNYVKKYFLHKS